MHYLYTALLVIHILSAILGVGPVFLLNMILRKAKTAEQLRYAHRIVSRLNRNANASFGLILLSGLSMGWINPWLFRLEWYIASLVLFFVSGVYAITAVEPILKQMNRIAGQTEDSDIPREHAALLQKKQVRDRVANLIAIAIILLMIVKPTF
ncbi:Predicted integral membrane protein [Chlamydia abortus]|uniref:DUF2269 family protein n=1 Tax=Paenibacillus residui TaxID=629724 RepID=A0ABW3DBJ5_9BACL|nr:DUF2269 family protein [Aneurinibacillus sp. XH2]SHE12694.1 Predicted integral membrane protein [Chlamydia abortus]